MGCINSTKKLNHGDIRSDNVMRVRAVRLLTNVSGGPSGILELNQRELVFEHGREQIVWALQHLRRYGLSSDVFSFEAGRRCMSGPGIYKFRIKQHAERFYPMFQRFINAVSEITAEDAERDRFEYPHPSTLLGRPADSNTNNYLEPTNAIPATNVVVMGQLRSSLQHESISGSPLSLNLDSPSSLPVLAPSTEILLHQQLITNSSANGNAYVNTSSNVAGNVYLEQPLPAQNSIEHNNNTNKPHTPSFYGAVSGVSSAFSTLKKRTITKRSSLDIPPSEQAPSTSVIPLSLLSPSGNNDAMHMYANVEGLGMRTIKTYSGFGLGLGNNNCYLRHTERDIFERCYENLNRSDITALTALLQPQTPLQHQPPMSLSLSSASSQCNALGGMDAQSSTSCNTPTTPGAVNYIVLDLDQPRSPAQCSPKTANFGSGLSLPTVTNTTDKRQDIKAIASTLTNDNHKALHTVSLMPGAVTQTSTAAALATVATAAAATITSTMTLSTPAIAANTSSFSWATKPIDEEYSAEEQEQLLEQQQHTALSYSTIDFIKTCALVKSTQHDDDFDSEDHELDEDHEESRITRHSKCVRKAFSISE